MRHTRLGSCWRSRGGWRESCRDRLSTRVGVSGSGTRPVVRREPRARWRTGEGVLGSGLCMSEQEAAGRT
jgi:hypothetical protein